MIELLRNCSHGCEFRTYFDSDNNIFIKSSHTERGIKSIINEYNGLLWYIKNAKKLIENFCKILVKKEKYIRLAIENIPLKKNDYHTGLSGNFEIIERALDHYCEVWQTQKNSERVNMHGDFSIDNILYDASELFIIDWEHFKENCVPVGFDAVYLLFESLWFNMNQRNGYEITEIETDFIADNLKKIKSKDMLNKYFAENVLYNLKKFMIDNKGLWEVSNENEMKKFPVIYFTDSQIVEIDKKLNDRFKE